MNVDLELYRVFCEVVKYKNITKTAENIHISQSAITQSIQKLEKLLGAKVFYRNKSGVQLTDEGEKLYEYIKNSVETMNNAENLFSQYINLENGRIRIGGGDTQISKFVIEPLTEFIKKYPNIGIYITPGRTEELVQKLSNGELDLITTRREAFNIKKYSNIDFIPLKKSVYSFFANNEYIKEHKIKSFKDIINSEIIVPKAGTVRNTLFEECCKKEQIEIERKYEVASSSTVKELVMRNIGVGFADNDSIKDIQDKIKILKQIELNDDVEGVATLNKKMCNKATIEFINYIKKYSNSL